VKCLSRMTRKCHVRFLEEGGGVTPSLFGSMRTGTALDDNLSASPHNRHARRTGDLLLTSPTVATHPHAETGGSLNSKPFHPPTYPCYMSACLLTRGGRNGRTTRSRKSAKFLCRLSEKCVETLVILQKIWKPNRQNPYVCHKKRHGLKPKLPKKLGT